MIKEDLKRSSEIFAKIYPDKEAERCISNCLKNKSLQINLLFKLCKKGKWIHTLFLNPMIKLSLVYLYLPYIYDDFAKMNIDEKIFYDTMDDIRIWIDDYKCHTGKYGLQELNWIMNHMSLKMFKLGRLQFQPIKYYFPKQYQLNDRTIKFGDFAVNVHIPRGEKLDISSCMQSFVQAQDFFKKHFPKYPTDFFVCHSWLIYSKNALYMKKDSNIIKFASLFDVVSESENPSQAYRWLFDSKINGTKENMRRKKHGSYSLPVIKGEETNLQKSAVDYIRKGGDLGDAMAVFNAADIKEVTER